MSSPTPPLRASAPLRELSLCLAAITFTFLTTIVVAAEPAIKLIYGDDGKALAVETTFRQELANMLANYQAENTSWPTVFAVYVDADLTQPFLPAVVGNYTIQGQVVRFTPRYPFRPGLTYRVESNPLAGLPGESGLRGVRRITIPAAPPTEPTRVTAIYPSADVLPENQLRFYIHFSAPMARGEAFNNIQLIRPDGQQDMAAFFEITGEELWDPSQQRLTVLFDPGRVKKGLSPRLEQGPILHEGKKYTLVINERWPDAVGNPLATKVEKRFTAGPPIETAIDHKQWRILPPAAGTRDPLAIEFPQPLDHALLRRTITIHTKADAPISGDVTITKNERRFEFRPDSPWSPGSYSLLIDTVLEDTAGNRIDRPFEVDVFDRIDKNLAPESLRLTFSIQ